METKATSQQQLLTPTKLPSKFYFQKNPMLIIKQRQRDTSRCRTKSSSPYLVGLQAAGNAVFVSAAAAIGQTAITAVLLGAWDVDITAAIHQQVLPFTNVSCKSETTLSIKPAGIPTPYQP